MDFLISIFAMDGTLGTIAAFVVAISIVVFVHEFGHYIVAVAFRIDVEVFSVGFGKAIVSWRDRKGTVWKIGMIPLGGYVRFVQQDRQKSGELDERELSESSGNREPKEVRALEDTSLVGRMSTVAAGPFFNFLFSTIVFAILAADSGILVDRAIVGSLRPLPPHVPQLEVGDLIVEVNGKEVQNYRDLVDYSSVTEVSGPTIYKVIRNGEMVTAPGSFPMPPLVTQVYLDTPASDSGIRIGDYILAVDGVEMRSFGQLRARILASRGEDLELAIWRKDETLLVRTTPRYQEIPLGDGTYERRVVMGLSAGLFFEPATKSRSFGDALYLGVNHTIVVLQSSIEGIVKIVSRQISSCNLQGPIGIAKVSGEAAAQGAGSFARLIAILSTAIGFLNLLPIPGLDGGHLSFYAYEAVSGRPPNKRIVAGATMIGILVLLALLAFSVVNDLTCP